MKLSAFQREVLLAAYQFGDGHHVYDNFRGQRRGKVYATLDLLRREGFLLGSTPNPLEPTDKGLKALWYIMREGSQQPCEVCGTQDSKLISCPYTLEIDDRDEPRWLCKGCEHERRMDI